MPRPTVIPIETEMSWRAVWKPERYDSDEDEPDSCCETKVKRPPFASPEGSWKRMPVICVCARPSESLVGVTCGKGEGRDRP